MICYNKYGPITEGSQYNGAGHSADTMLLNIIGDATQGRLLFTQQGMLEVIAEYKHKSVNDLQNVRLWCNKLLKMIG